MTCRCCIHFDACSTKGKTRYYGRIVACDDVEERCEFFRNKANVVEVRHGEWIEKWDSQHFVSSCICSVCGKGTHRDSLMKWAKGAYCQNCGAKMDGKGD